MSARMDAPIECACDELAAHHTLEMMLRHLMGEQAEFPGEKDRNQITTGYRLVFRDYLAKLDAVRAIKHAQQEAQ